MVDFKSKNKKYRSDAYKVYTQKSYDTFTEEIKGRVAKISEEKFFLGVALHQYYVSEAYACRASDDDVKEYGWFADRNACAQCFFAVCEIDFGLDKSQVSRLINVVVEFGDGYTGLKKQWKDYKWTILCEMLPLTPEQRKPIKTDWSRRRVQEYKKNLVAPVQQKNEQEEIDFDTLDDLIAGADAEEDEDRYDKYKPAELRSILRQRDHEIASLKAQVSELQNGDKYRKMQEDLDYYKRLAIANMSSGDDVAE